MLQSQLFTDPAVAEVMEFHCNDQPRLHKCTVTALLLVQEQILLLHSLQCKAHMDVFMCTKLHAYIIYTLQIDMYITYN